MIRTVLGDISPNDLGHTQCHEHVYLEKGKSFEVSPVLLMDDESKSLEELTAYRSAGGKTIVDAQPVFCGRRADILEKLSSRSNVNIVASTGFHVNRFYYDDSYLFSFTEDEMTRLYMHEIEIGMHTDENKMERIADAKAGVMKTGVDKTGNFKSKQFYAAANAAALTGVPVLCHTESNCDVLGLIRFFEDAGIEPSKTIICHLDRARYDLGYHKEVLQTGAYLEYDTINRLKYLSNKQEIDLITAMLEAGFEDQILLSLDTTNARMRAYGAEMGLDYILKTFIPILKSEGVYDEDLIKMTRKNAEKALKIN